MKKVKHRVTKKIKQNETVDQDSESGAAILLLAGFGLGVWAWLRSRRQVEPLATRQFRNLPTPNLNPSRPIMRRFDEKQFYPIWNPAYSHHWRG